MAKRKSGFVRVTKKKKAEDIEHLESEELNIDEMDEEELENFMRNHGLAKDAREKELNILFHGIECNKSLYVFSKVSDIIRATQGHVGVQFQNHHLPAVATHLL